MRTDDELTSVTIEVGRDTVDYLRAGASAAARKSGEPLAGELFESFTAGFQSGALETAYREIGAGAWSGRLSTLPRERETVTLTLRLPPEVAESVRADAAAAATRELDCRGELFSAANGRYLDAVKEHTAAILEHAYMAYAVS
jgi:hypothetical protein